MKRLFVPLVLIAVACVLSLRGVAQEATRPFVPVTDEMLQKPDPADWLSWRRTLDSQGFSPLTQINRNNVAKLQHDLDAPHRTRYRQSGGDAARLQRRDVRPEPGDYIMAVDAKTGDVHLGIRRKLPGHAAVDQPQHGDLGHDAHRRAAPTTTCTPSTPGPGSWCGKHRSSIRRCRVNASSGPIIANGKVIAGRQCQPRRRPTTPASITAHDARTGKELWRTRTIPRPGEPGDETLGRRADERAVARRHLDGAELRPGAEPDHRRHVGDDPGAEVHSRRQRQGAPVPQLHARASTPTPARSSGTTSTSSITGISIIRSSGSSWTPPSRPTRRKCPGSTRGSSRARGASVITGIPGKTGVVYTLDRQDRRVPLGAADGVAERDQQDRRRHRQGDRQSGGPLHARSTRRSSSARARSGGKNWPAGAYNPQTNVMFYPLQNMCMNGDDDDRQARPGAGLRPQHAGPASRPAPRMSARVWAISAETGRDAVEVRAARRHAVARRHRRRPGVRRRRQRTLQGLRRADRQDAVGDEPRRAGQRLSDLVRRRRQAVHRRATRADRSWPAP